MRDFSNVFSVFYRVFTSLKSKLSQLMQQDAPNLSEHLRYKVGCYVANSTVNAFHSIFTYIRVPGLKRRMP